MKRGLGTYQLVAALGIVAWWVYWLGTDQYRKDPAAEAIYEGSFPPADLVFAALLVVSGLAWWRALPVRYAVAGLVAGGMGLALAVVDTFHNVLVGAFDHPTPAALAQKLVFAVVNASVGALSIGVTWRRRDEVGVRDLPLPAATRWIGALAAVALAAAARDWVIDRGVPADALPFLRSLIAPSALAFGFAAGAGGTSHAPLTLACAGACLHRWLLVATSDVERGLLVPDALVAGGLALWAASAALGARALVR